MLRQVIVSGSDDYLVHHLLWFNFSRLALALDGLDCLLSRQDPHRYAYPCAELNCCAGLGLMYASVSIMVMDLHGWD